jgi:hypothetical protein
MINDTVEVMRTQCARIQVIDVQGLWTFIFPFLSLPKLTVRITLSPAIVNAVIFTYIATMGAVMGIFYARNLV